MKKITSILLAALMIVSVMALASCKKPETPESLVNGAIEKTNAYDAYEIDMLMEMSMNVMGMEMTIPLDMHVMTSGEKEDNPITSMNMTIELLGMSSTVDMYSEGDWAYITADDESFKMNLEDAKEQVGSTDTSYLESIIPADIFEGTEIIENEDGTKSVELVIPDDRFTEIFPTMLDSMTSTMGTGTAADIKISNAKITITVADGLIKGFDMTFDMEMTIEGIAVTASAKVESDYLAFGEDVVITPPEGYLDFPDYSEY